MAAYALRGGARGASSCVVAWLLCVLCCVAFWCVSAVDRHKFRTCEQTGFCKRLRTPNQQPEQALDNFNGIYRVDFSSFRFDEKLSTVHFDLSNSAFPLQDPLQASISILVNGVVRFYVKEKAPLHGQRYEVHDVLQQSGMTAAAPIQVQFSEEDKSRAVVISYQLRSHPVWPGAFIQQEFQDRLIPVTVSISSEPFVIRVAVDGETVMVANQRQLFTFEQGRNKNPKPEPPAAPQPPANENNPDAAAVVNDGENQQQQVQQEQQQQQPAAAEVPPAPQKFPYDVDGMWEEHFGGHHDSKPKGPSAVGLDVSFIGSSHVYGIPEHAAKFALKSTHNGKPGDYTDPYRLYNLDVFEYELDNPMALYGAVPLLLSHTKNVSTGFFWLNTAETFIDISESPTSAAAAGASSGLLSSLFGSASNSVDKESHWMSESGVIDAFFFVGPAVQDVWRAYATLTGYSALPPRFSIAYHQCRWNYKNEEDVAAVESGFDAHDIPFDVLWLDIEHTDGKKYFTWDKTSFPTPQRMQRALSDHGRKMVNIVDPHIKRDGGYRVHTSAQSQNLYIEKKGGGDYEGWCWPGSVSYLDFFRSDVRDYWSQQFLLGNYEGSTKDLYIWNDMNEPSVFNGPEVTMPKDNTHLQGAVEHRDVHNQYGFYVQMATESGLRLRDDKRNQRPFVLTRSFFSGSQAYGAVWTGDNRAAWTHLAAAQPMLLSLNVAGITFSGADVGGFFGDPDVQLLVRWYQAAAYHPFFRGHAHIDTKRREPWLFGEPHTAQIRQAIRTRYALLPYVYTLFYQAATTGTPVMRPLWAEFPKDANTFATEDAFLLGNALLVRPITDPDVYQVTVYLPVNDAAVDVWYSDNGDAVSAYAAGQSVSLVRTLQQGIPVFQRGGTIIPRRDRARRSSALMEDDPFTLHIALNRQGGAFGTVYLDDGESYDYTRGEFLFRSFTFTNNQLSSAKLIALHSATNSEKFSKQLLIERIIIAGIQNAPTAITVSSADGQARTLTFHHEKGRLTIRKPEIAIHEDFLLTLS